MNPIKVGLVGFGRAGREGAKEIIRDKELRLSWIARRTWRDEADITEKPHRKLHLEGRDYPALTVDELSSPACMRAHKVDLVIDFASSNAIRHYGHLARQGVRIVSAVSHYEDSDKELFRLASRLTATLHSPNITLGINLVYVMARMLRRVIPQADVQITEEHFSQKRGRSGTAERLALMLGLEPDDVISSIRAGGIIGKHELIFGLPNQTIRMVHETINRRAFARGALLAGKWLMDSEPGLYSMEKLVFKRIREGLNEDAEEASA
jgi:4-hydroxy-tetrahydrodipicolinate reductase